jgi:hypothetical protein
MSWKNQLDAVAVKLADQARAEVAAKEAAVESFIGTRKELDQLDRERTWLKREGFVCVPVDGPILRSEYDHRRGIGSISQKPVPPKPVPHGHWARLIGMGGQIRASGSYASMAAMAWEMIWDGCPDVHLARVA